MKHSKAKLVLLGLSFSTLLHATVNYPKYKVLRQAEDWSFLANVSQQEFNADPWNKIKYIPVGNGYLTLGGSTRGRAEYWDNFAWNTANNAGFGLWNMFLNADYHLNKNFRLFLELKSAFASNRNLPGGIRTLDEDQFAWQQGFVDITFFPTETTSLTIRPGRQMFLLGRQRLVSPLQWSNTYRTWDGVSALIKNKNWKIQAFGFQNVPVVRRAYNTANAAITLNGIYATHQGKHNQDFYYLNTQRAAQGFLGPAGTTIRAMDKRHTLGARFYGSYDGWLDYDNEAAVQVGKWGATNIRAFMVALLGAHTFKEMDYKPQIYAGYDYASGSSPSSNNRNTFLQLFPLGHAYLGWMDYVGRQNINSASCWHLFRVI